MANKWFLSFSRADRVCWLSKHLKLWGGKGKKWKFVSMLHTSEFRLRQQVGSAAWRQAAWSNEPARCMMGNICNGSILTGDLHLFVGLTWRHKGLEAFDWPPPVGRVRWGIGCHTTFFKLEYISLRKSNANILGISYLFILLICVNFRRDSQKF